MKPIRLLFLRHGLSEANLRKEMNARKADHAIELAPEGHEQAKAAGEAIASFLRQDGDALGATRIMCSPYLRTRQTAEGVKSALERNGIPYDVREEIALREQSFGLFDGIRDEELPRLFPREHAHYEKHVQFEGEAFAPMPLGESRIQVADRVRSVFGTILRDADPSRDRSVENFIIVSHGVTIRMAIMQWLHLPWEWAEREPNPWNCSVTLIEGRGGGMGYKKSQLFDGFKHVRDAQEKREEGHVEVEQP